MKSKRIDSILKEVLFEAKPSKEELSKIEERLKDFKLKLEKKIKKSKLKVDVFIGGSFAKKTMMRKKEYDVDIFLRFNKKNARGKEISKLTEKVLKDFRKTKIHGSRDYFMIKPSKNLVFEVIPVLKVKNPKEAENITDLSYFHVNYMKKKLKKGKISEEIILAKTFCHANGFYGAESYIKGFSGYGLELIVEHYGSFVKFLKETTKAKDKIIIDEEKHFKNKQQVLMDLNTAKLTSPIILIDPTFKQRNTLAALSEETFENFVKVSKRFLSNPQKSFFERKEFDLEKIKKNSVKRKNEFLVTNLKTNKQGGDIAGSKLLKFYNHLVENISKKFYVKNKGFIYNDKKEAECFFCSEKEK